MALVALGKKRRIGQAEKKWELSGCHGVARLGLKNWEEPFGPSVGSYLLPKKSGAE